MAHVSRRAVLAAGVTAAAASAIGANSGIAFAVGGGAQSLPGGGSFVQIVAHTDDDLLFLNPDIQPSILSGQPVRTIVLGADENEGWDEGGWSREDLAASVQEGSRSGYAALAGKPNNWTRATKTVATMVVEIDTLVGQPNVQLIYLSLPDGGDPLHRDALKNLWLDAGYVTDTILPTDSPVGFVQQYNQNDLNNVLLELLNTYQPTVIRIQDPHPNDALPGLTDPEHEDHVYAALFAQKAVKAYEGPDGRKFALLTRYRYYNTETSPENVPNALRGTKAAGYAAYAEHDPITGDRFDRNVSRNYQRWPVVSPWAATDGTGALHAFIVAGDSVMHWHQPVNGAWVGPVSLTAGTYAPGVAVAKRGDGLLQIAVLDLDTGSILTARQTGPGAGFGSWSSVGNPDGAAPAYGTPCFGVNHDGGLELFAVNRNDELSNAWEENGGFSAWTAVPATNGVVMSPPVALTAPSGRMHVFCDGNGSLLHWQQDPQQSMVLKPVTAESTHAPAVTVDNGKVRVVTREHGDGAIGTLAESTPNGNFGALAHIGGQGGVGPVAAAASAGEKPAVFAFARNDAYGISVAKKTATGSFGAWQDLGGYAEIAPTAVRDAMGLVRVLVVGGDAKLHERKQTASGPDGQFGPWQQAGD